MECKLGGDARRECSVERLRKTSKTRQRRSLTSEFNTQPVRLYRVGDSSISEAVKDFDLPRTALREWVQRADIDVSTGPARALTSGEGAERPQRFIPERISRSSPSDSRRSTAPEGRNPSDSTTCG